MLNGCYAPPLLSHWIGRSDVPNGRLFQRINLLDCQDLKSNLSADSIVFLGFVSDEGVRRNLGRPGAAQGPDHLRKALGNIPLSPDDSRSIWDVGNILCKGDDLETAQMMLSQLVAQLREQGAFVIILGGGHEVAWGHFQGLIKDKKNCDCIDVLNFDAHLDLRPLLLDRKGTSGTSFRQIQEDCQEKKIACRYACIGVQPFGNTSPLFEYAKSIETYHVLAEQIVNEPQQVHSSLEKWLASAESIYLTLCLDVFGAAYAPGVSAPQPMGLSPHALLPFFRQVLKSGKVIGFDIAELNPLFDRDHQTAALGASFIAEVLKYVG